MAKTFQEWHDRLEPGTRSRTLATPTEDGKWSASKVPVQAFLQFHLLQDVGSRPSRTSASLQASSVVSEGDVRDAEKLIAASATSPSAGEIGNLLTAFEQIAAGVQTTSAQPESLNFFTATLLAYEQLQQTPLESTFVPSVEDAPRTTKVVHYGPRKAVPAPDFTRNLVVPHTRPPQLPTPLQSLSESRQLEELGSAFSKCSSPTPRPSRQATIGLQDHQLLATLGRRTARERLRGSWQKMKRPSWRPPLRARRRKRPALLRHPPQFRVMSPSMLNQWLCSSIAQTMKFRHQFSSKII